MRGKAVKEKYHSILCRKVYVFATHGIFSGVAKSVIKESPNLEKVLESLWAVH